MNKRKLKIIDKKFQLQTTFSVIGIFFIITCLFIVTIAINVYKDNNRINQLMKEQNNILNLQEEINNIIIENLIIKENNQINQKIKEKNTENIALLKNNIEMLNKLTSRNNEIFLILVIFVISTGFILYPLLISKTHKISGPIHIMSVYIKEIMAGNSPNLRPLRKNDELKEFYKLFLELISYIKKIDKKEKNDKK
jgi:hypothetical protein